MEVPDNVRFEAIRGTTRERAVHFDPSFFVVFPVFVLSVIVHECAHGVVALWCGDSTARDRGRLTLNPVPHFDPMGSLVVPGLLYVTGAPFLFGWARPVPVERAQMRDLRNGPVFVALAGPASNILLAIGFAALARIAPATGFWEPLRTMGYAGVLWNCALAIFNLVPIPPLDGAWVVMRFMRLRHILALHHFRPLGFVLLLALLLLPGPSRVLFQAPLAFAVRACLGMFGLASGAAHP
jgi:Zn-dependent protease